VDAQELIRLVNGTGRVDFQRQREVFTEAGVKLDTPAQVLAAFCEEDDSQRYLASLPEPPVSREYHTAVAAEYTALASVLIAAGVQPDPVVVELLGTPPNHAKETARTASPEDEWVKLPSPPTSCGVCGSNNKVSLYYDDDDKPSHYYCDWCGQHLGWYEDFEPAIHYVSVPADEWSTGCSSSNCLLCTRCGAHVPDNETEAHDLSHKENT
jgi:hypothetical protein